MKHAGLSIIFIIGCVAGGVGSQLVVPRARAGTAPTRWEYHCANGADLAKFGAEGWEMVSAFPSHMEHKFGGDFEADHYGFCFKRAL